MKRTLTWFVLALGLLALPAAAQQRFSLQLNGHGGMGYNWSNTSSGPFDSSSARNGAFTMPVDSARLP